MKKIYFRMKYNWHILKYQKAQGELEKGKDQFSKTNLEQQKSFHERSALQSMLKF